MAYNSKRGKRPMEWASKSSHTNIIKDSSIQDFLKLCDLPKTSYEIDVSSTQSIAIDDLRENPIKRIIAIDGGYKEVSVKNEFPSSKVAFMQFGATFFEVSDLENLKSLPFIDEEDMKKLRDIERIKLVIPTKGITLKEAPSLNISIRKTIYDFFIKKPDDRNHFIDTLKWFIFKEYYNEKECKDEYSQYQLASCPNLGCNSKKVILYKEKMDEKYQFICPNCEQKIFLTDVFRLHEVIDEELGASGILGYLVSLIEQIFIVHIIRLMLKTRASLLEETLFIKDGPLAFFGQTANMHKPMRELLNYLNKSKKLYLVGIEKTGAFVEHADQIREKMKPGEVLLLNNDYIYKYIIPGEADPKNPYASTSYYSGKIIFKDRNEKMYVVTLPIKDPFVINNPQKDDYRNIDVILNNIEKLKCDMYDDALLPIALVNKLVSLADHPSSVILEKFAKSKLHGH
ncbi:DNA double-strand break repair nuclease NurA [Anoxybacillus ayderensis]|uniref:DNA double-strand break repair nuclease NurA n=1 Tax=Anoxybacillus ayderensis TaxID=265546 RepID=UPI001CB8D6C6|nr:DNA double-strand break repair nuclease NurA [Anoxybacillus ayderensis]